MTILTSEITESTISLSTYETIGELSVLYGNTLNNGYGFSTNTTSIVLTLEDLELDTFNNVYFAITVTNVNDSTDTASIGLYEICVENDNSSKLYNATSLKQDLDDLNYYDTIIKSLTEKEDYYGANDMFNNFITTLEDLYGNNLLDSVDGSDVTGSCS